MAFIGNSLNTVRFQKLVKDKLEEREADMLKKHNLIMEVDMDFADIFNSSSMVSQVININPNLYIVQKGRSHQLLRKIIVKREKDQKEQEGKHQKELLESLPHLKEEISNLKDEIASKDKNLDRFNQDAGILEELYRKGVIDENGNLIEGHDE